MRQKKRYRRRIGLLGGSFNPAHEGHLHISIEALKLLNLDEVWWLVSPQNPLKSSKDMGSLETRVFYAQQVAQNYNIWVTDIERHLQTCYTAETLRALQKKFHAYDFVWLMGADNLLQFPKWKNWQQIIEAAPVAVFGRSGYDLNSLSGQVAQKYRHARVPVSASRFLLSRSAPAWCFLPIRRHPESATRIRAQAQTERQLEVIKEKHML